MSDEHAHLIMEELRLLRGEINSLKSQMTVKPASTARIEPYTVSEFSKIIRRHREWVSDRCRAKLIKTLPGKPYRIPVSEVSKWAGGESS